MQHMLHCCHGSTGHCTSISVFAYILNGGIDMLGVGAFTYHVHCCPTLWCCRVGDHSTSDDWTAYRPKEEVQEWINNKYPNTRLMLHLINRGLWDESRDKELRKEVRRDILAAFKRAEEQPKPHPSTMFGDVYDTLPPRLQAQYEEMLQHVKKYPQHYPLEKYQVTD